MTHRIIAKPRRIRYQRSPSQLKRMNAFRTCRNVWMGKRPGYRYQRWQNFAVGKETAWNAFLRINLVRAFNDLPLLTFPPGVV